SPITPAAVPRNATAIPASSQFPCGTYCETRSCEIDETVVTAMQMPGMSVNHGFLPRALSHTEIVTSESAAKSWWPEPKIGQRRVEVLPDARAYMSAAAIAAFIQ